MLTTHLSTVNSCYFMLVQFAEFIVLCLSMWKTEEASFAWQGGRLWPYLTFGRLWVASDYFLALATQKHLVWPCLLSGRLWPYLPLCDPCHGFCVAVQYFRCLREVQGRREGRKEGKKGMKKGRREGSKEGRKEGLPRCKGGAAPSPQTPLQLF